jgi:hypothetical protein
MAETAPAAASSECQRRPTATAAAAARTIATKAVPTTVRPPWKTSIPGTTIAPTSPSDATVWEF